MNLFKVSHFRILQKLGSGGSADVFLAEDLNLRRKVALKLLHRHLTSEPEKVERFRQEAQWACMLNHPNILTIFEVGEEDGAHFIVSEHVEGETLRKRLSRTLPIPELLGIAIGVASGLVAAHEAWIVHRDLKPENVMLRPDGWVKILDFGVAKLTHDLSLGPRVMTQPKMLLGTIEYMSPEQLQGEGVDPRTDVFGLGVLLHEMVTGSSPFHRPTWMEMIAAITREDPAPTVRDGETVPPELQRIVSKALQKDSAERYQMMSEMLGDLRELRQELAFQERQKRAESGGVP